MVNLREINRFRPSDRQPGIYDPNSNERYKRGISGTPNFPVDEATSGIERYISNTKQKYKNYQNAKKDALSNDFQEYVRLNQEPFRAAGNQIATVGELASDIFQLVPEALSQGAGYLANKEDYKINLPGKILDFKIPGFGENDVGNFLLNRGSGIGLGDTMYDLNKNIFGIDYDEKEESERIARLNQTKGDTNPETLDDLLNSIEFQNHLRGSGYNLPRGKEFNRDTYLEEIISPGLDIESLDDYRNDNLFDNYEAGGMDGIFYNDENKFDNALKERYENKVVTPARIKKHRELETSFFEGQNKQNIAGIAEELGISEQLAESILFDEAPNPDRGILKDLLNYGYDPFDYKTDAGRELFDEDPIVSGITSLLGYGTAGKLAKKAFSNKYINNTVGQLYPISAKKRALYNLKKGKDGAKYNFDIPYVSSPFSRSAIQGGGILGLSDAITRD